jgi:hypothetical protein
MADRLDHLANDRFRPMPAPPPALPSRAELDSLVINVELTLTSIIQGVALSFLCENAHDPLVALRWEVWPFLLNGLLLIFLFWSRSIGHTLTVIRWPLDFSHNFLYIGAVLLESVIFTQVNNPVAWFTLLSLFSLLVWILFVTDQRIIRKREREYRGTAWERLVIQVKADQRVNIFLLVPLLCAFHTICAVVIFESGPGIRPVVVWVCVITQFVSFFGYLIYLLRFLARLALHAQPVADEERQGETAMGRLGE